MLDNYQIIIQKLDDFIRRFYKNKLIKGSLIAISLILSFFLLVNLLEYFFHLSILGRTLLFYFFLVLFLLVFAFWIAVPLFQLFKLGKIITHEQAATLIGKFFPEVDDQILNTIQLARLSGDNDLNLNLLHASIEQRSVKFVGFSFKPAIRYSTNKKYLKFVLPPVFIFIALLILAPNIITEPTDRLIKHNVVFVEKAPFEFVIENSSLEIIQNEDFELKIKLKGKEIPEFVFIETENQKIRLQKTDILHFKHTFKTVNRDISFILTGDKFTSERFVIKVIPKPTITSFSVSVEYPKYTGKKNEVFENNSDISIPAGSLVKWNFNTRDTRKLSFVINDSAFSYLIQEGNRINIKKTLYKDLNYSILTSNEFLQSRDSLKYLIQVIQDAYPLINVEEFADSISDSRKYFRGFVKDDYGFSKLWFKFINKSNNTGQINTISIPLNSLQAQFFHFFDLTSLNLKPGDNIEYYFEIFDNDGIHGPKSVKSQVFKYAAPSQDQLKQMNEERSDELKKMINQSANQAARLQKEIVKMQEKLNNQKDLSWQDKDKLENLTKQFEQLQKNLEEIKKENEIKNVKENEFKQEDERIVEKQKELQELMEKLLTPEMKEMLEQMKKMLENELQKQDAMKMLDQMKLENKDIEKQLDRNLEIFKQMEFDQKFQDAINKLDEIKEKQDKLNQQTENKKIDKDELQKQQEDLNKQFSDFKEMMQDADKSNKELEQPNNFEKFEKEQEGIENEMKNSSEMLKSGKSGNASKSQKNASQQMQSLSDKMKQMQSDMEQEQQEEDMAALRDILENLIQTSFNEENLIAKVAKTSNTDPKYPALIQEQKKIREDLKMIEDSLLALSKRQATIEPFINKEIGEINRNVESTLSSLTGLYTIGPVSEYDRKSAIGKQQFVLTSVNNLALMLNEVLQQMQQQQQQAKSGKGKKCSKPKPGQGMQSMRKMQEQLNKQMQEMQKKMKEGQGKPGQSQKSSNGMSEQFSRMAAEQEALRRKVQEYQEQLKKQGLNGEAKQLNKITEEMEKTETELVNRMVSEESFKRQQDIVTRMLEAEKAERERDENEERQSNEAKDIFQRNFERFLEYNKNKSTETELLKTIPAEMKPFYKNRVNNYFENIQTF